MWRDWQHWSRTLSPSYTPRQIANYLKTNAQPRGVKPNNDWGHGFARLPALPSAVTPSPTPVTADIADRITEIERQTATLQQVIQNLQWVVQPLTNRITALVEGRSWNAPVFELRAVPNPAPISPEGTYTTEFKLTGFVPTDRNGWGVSYKCVWYQDRRLGIPIRLSERKDCETDTNSQGYPEATYVYETRNPDPIGVYVWIFPRRSGTEDQCPPDGGIPCRIFVYAQATFTVPDTPAPPLADRVGELENQSATFQQLLQNLQSLLQTLDNRLDMLDGGALPPTPRAFAHARNRQRLRTADRAGGD